MSTTTAGQRSASPTEPAPPSTRGLGLALAIIGGAQLMVVLDATIANIALPYIQTTSTSAGAACRGSSPATRWPSAACCCSAAGSATSSAAAGCS